MASTSDFVSAMNLVSLEDEEEGGLDIVIGGEDNNAMQMRSTSSMLNCA